MNNDQTDHQPSAGSISTRLMSPEELHTHLLSATYRCIRNLGLAKMTIQDLAREAEVSRPTVYKYLGNKKQIISTIAERESFGVKSEVSRRLKRTGIFEEDLCNILFLINEITRKNPILLQVLKTIDFPANALQRNSEYHRQQKVWWGGLIVRAVKDGQIAADLSVDDVVLWLTSSMQMLLIKTALPGISKAELKRFIKRFVVRPLLP